MHPSFLLSTFFWIGIFHGLILYSGQKLLKSLGMKGRRTRNLTTNTAFMFLGFTMLIVSAVINNLNAELNDFLKVGAVSTIIFSTNAIVLTLFYRPNDHRNAMLLHGIGFFGGGTWLLAMYGVHEGLFVLNLDEMQGITENSATLTLYHTLGLVLFFYFIILVILFHEDIKKRVQYRQVLSNESVLFLVGELLSLATAGIAIIAFFNVPAFITLLSIAITLGTLAIGAMLAALLYNQNVAFVDYLVLEMMLTTTSDLIEKPFGHALFYVGKMGPEIHIAEIPPTLSVTDDSKRTAMDLLMEVGIKAMTQTGLGSEYGESVLRFDLEAPLKGSFIFLTGFGSTKSGELVDPRFGNRPYLGFTFFVTDPQYKWLLDRTDAWKRVLKSLQATPVETITSEMLITSILDAIQYLIVGSW